MKKATSRSWFLPPPQLLFISQVLNNKSCGGGRNHDREVAFFICVGSYSGTFHDDGGTNDLVTFLVFHHTCDGAVLGHRNLPRQQQGKHRREKSDSLSHSVLVWL